MFKEMFTNSLSSIMDSQSRVEMRNDLLVHSYSSFFDGFLFGDIWLGTPTFERFSNYTIGEINQG